MIYPDQLGNSVIYDIYTYCSYPTSIHISTYYLYIIVNYIYIYVYCVYTCNRLLSTGMVYGIEFAPILRSGKLTVRELENHHFDS